MIDAAFTGEGGGPPSFPHIVGSGPNALIIHYDGDDRQLGDGDLVLIDIGATYDGHSADMSRTFPVSGPFTTRQREIYQLVLDAQRAVVTRLRPGVDTLSSTQAWVRDVFRASPLRAKDASGVARTLDVFLTHSVYHYVGRDVHGADTGWNARAALQPHQIFTMEPGLYITSEGIGIRIEDTYMVTERGVACLTCACPKEVADLEARQTTGARPR
jgi:Xaa-Pro aminopeptidase